MLFYFVKLIIVMISRMRSTILIRQYFLVESLQKHSHLFYCLLTDDVAIVINVLLCVHIGKVKDLI